MKQRRVLLAAYIIAAVGGCGCSQIGNDGPGLQDQYFGLEPPGNNPEVFAPGIVSDGRWGEHSQVAISPKGDEIFWSAWSSEYPSEEGGNTEQIYYVRFQDGEWTKPALAEFVKDNLSRINGGPVFSLDGEKLFFYSVNRPGGLGDMDTWYVEKTDGEWKNPINVGEPYNTTGNDWSPTFPNPRCAYSNFNHTLRYHYTGGKFSKPDTVLIGEDYKPAFAIQVSSEESYVLFSAVKESGFGGLDLYISFKGKDGAWGEPKNLGKKINTEMHERFPVISPDGKYMFFMRHTESQDFFWVSTQFLDEMHG